MNTEKLTEIFIGDGTAFDANNTAMASIANQLNVVGYDMTCLNPGGGDTITTQPYIYLVNKLANGDLKRSFAIKGTSVTAWEGKKYTPARRCVWGIGYQRGSIVDGTTVAASGSITVNNETDYTFRIAFKWDKRFYSERQESLNVTFKSAVTATQSNIATQITDAINNSSFGSQPANIKCIKAVKVGNGTGIMGLTGATNFGVEIWGLDVDQFRSTSYTENQVYFSVHVDDSTGFETTSCLQMQSARKGVGTYNQIYNMENKFYGNEGVLNRTKFPIPTLAYLTSATYTSSGNVAAAATSPTGNVSVTISEDLFTVVTATTGLRPGEIIDVDGTQYEIKYIRSATTFVGTVVATATYSGANLKVKYLYDVFNIEVTDVTTLDGPGVGQFSKKVLVIATPAIDASAADPFDTTGDSADASAEVLDIFDVLNGWMTTTPLAPAALTLTNMI